MNRKGTQGFKRQGAQRVFWGVVLLVWPVFVFGQATPQLVPFLSGLSDPVYITSARDGSNRLFILEQTGRVLVMQPGSRATSVFLDVRAKVSFGGERGLLGIAFHPQFKANRRFFINYTRAGDGATIVSEFQASATNSNLAETTERVFLTIAQPFANHNGGMIDFGPDGYLYIGMGDGGSANDPGNRSQNIEDFHGKMLRIDVDTPNGAVPYSSPSTNPFFGPTAGRDEIYALGLRNPWRWSFDRATGQLYAGDVGQGVIEEISIITIGGNYGWRVYEGTRCTNLGPAACNPANYVAPLLEYYHSGGRCSVTGGYVYRGSRGTFPAGSYLFGDYCTGEIFITQNNSFRVLLDTDLNIASFGEDEAGELFVVDLSGGIYRLTAPVVVTPVSAASYSGERLAPESIAAAFGVDLSAGEAAAQPGTVLPLELAGTTVRVKDAAGAERSAPLFYVSPKQINFQIPPGTVSGTATVSVTPASALLSQGSINVQSISPGVFAVDASGGGLAAAQVLRIRDGAATYEPIAQYDAAQQKYLPVPIDLGPATDDLFLVLYGTGFRFRGSLSGVTATIGGEPGQVVFAGVQPDFVGLDQANVRLPRSLAGRGDAEVRLTVDGLAANPVTVRFK